MYKSNFSLADRISIVSDEISDDFIDASLFANNEASIKSSDISSDTIDILSASEKFDLYMLWEHVKYKGRVSHLLSHCFTES